MKKQEKYNWDRTEAIIEEYIDQLLRIAYSHTGNMSDAEDIVQEVFISFARKGPREDKYIQPWLIRVTINKSLNLMKSAYKKKQVELDESFMNKSEEKEKVSLDECIEQIPPKYQAPLYLYYYEGYTIDEISGMLNKKKSSVYTLIDRGRSKLREIIKEDEDEK